MKHNTILLSLAGSAVLFLSASCATYDNPGPAGRNMPPPQGQSVQTMSSAPQMQAMPAMQFITGTKYSFGVMHALVNANIFTLDRAVRSTCSRARLISLNRITRSNEVQYTYRDVQNVRLTITIRETPNAQTELKIKVDKFGNKINSEQLLAAIDEDLKAINQPAH